MDSLEKEIKDLKYVLTTAKFNSPADRAYFEGKLLRLQSLLKASRGKL